MAVLLQFVYRLSFGLAAAMALTPARHVSSGYYRVHLWVLMGFNVLASAVALGSAGRFAVWPPIAAATLCYVGSVIWLYEKPRPGLVALVLVAALGIVSAWLVQSPAAPDPSTAPASAAALSGLLVRLAPLTGGLLLGSTMAAMLLGHWYLNHPGMSLLPLKRLVVLMGIAVLLRAAVSAAGLGLALGVTGWPATVQPWFLALRWLAGIAGALLVVTATWQTLKIPNTQSATGILYVGVIVTFVGELTSQLLSAASPFPL